MSKNIENLTICVAILGAAQMVLTTQGWVGGPECLASEAVNPQGGSVSANHSSAVRFTPFGAIIKGADQQSENLRRTWVDAQSWFKRHLNLKYGHTNIMRFNRDPGTTLQKVLEEFDEVIADLRGRIAREEESGRPQGATINVNTNVND